MNKKGNIELFFGGLVILVVVLMLVFGIGYGCKYAFTSGNEVIVVKTKWTKIIGGTEMYRVTSTGGQTFVIEDSFVNGQFESASVYANIDEGKKYTIKTQGFRFGFFSDFKKIVKAVEVK